VQVILVVLAVVLIWFAVEGLRQGVLRRAVEVVGLIAVFLFASSLSGALQPWLTRHLGVSERAAFFASWGIVLVAGIVGVRLLAAWLSRLVRVSVVGWLDRVGGLALGLAFGAIVGSCILIGLLAAPIDDGLKDEISDHEITGPLLHVAPAVYDVARQAWQGEPFFEMLREHAGAAARKTAEELRAAVDEMHEGEEDSHP
jgi:hypothetical protein